MNKIPEKKKKIHPTSFCFCNIPVINYLNISYFAVSKLTDYFYVCSFINLCFVSGILKRLINSNIAYYSFFLYAFIVI